MPAQEILVLFAISSSEDLGESTHMRRLPRAFPARIHYAYYMKTQAKYKTSSSAGYVKHGHFSEASALL